MSQRAAEAVKPVSRVIPRHVIMSIAGAVPADEKTVRKVIAGEPVRGSVYFRIREELVRRGYKGFDPEAL
jgi:hypothetical protein